MGSLKWDNQLFSSFSVERFYLMEYKVCCINLHFRGVRGDFGWVTYWFFRSSVVKVKGINGMGLLWLQSGLYLEGKYQRSKANLLYIQEEINASKC